VGSHEGALQDELSLPELLVDRLAWLITLICDIINACGEASVLLALVIPLAQKEMLEAFSLEPVKELPQVDDEPLLGKDDDL